MSSTEQQLERPQPAPAPPTEGQTEAATRHPWRQRLGFANIGAIYVWIAMIVILSFWAPETFPTYATVQQVLNQNAVIGLMALSIVIPLSAGVFDLSIGYALGLCNILTAWLIAVKGVPVGVAVTVVLAAALLIGVVNATIVVVFKIDSFIGTLATGSLLLAGVTWVSDQKQIIDPKLTEGFFAQISRAEIGGIQLPVFYMVIVALLVWYVLEHTVSGRHIYAAGFNADAAHLVGISVDKLRFVALVTSSVISGGVAGIVVTSQISSGSTTVGPPFLLNAFAAAFLGATQLKRGRFNPWGTLIAVLMLGTGSAGLALAGTPPWAPAVFTGVVLLVALGMTRAERGSSSVA